MIKPKHRKVIDGYMKGMSKKEAMIAAGYSESMARTRANDVFGRPEIIAEMSRRQNLAAHRSDVGLDWIVERLKSIADANIGDMIDVYSDGTAKINLSKMNDDMRRALSKFSVDSYTEGRGKNAQEVKRVRVDFSDKLKALELLVRHLGLSKEKQQIEVSGEVSLAEALQQGRDRARLRHEDEEDVPYPRDIDDDE